MKNGFTLIELLVSLAIGSLLLGMGIGGYRLFISHRQARLAANELYSQLLLIQSQARNGVKSRSCARLDAYEVRWFNSQLAYRQRCQNWQQAWQTLTANWYPSLGGGISFYDGDDNRQFLIFALSGRLGAINQDPAKFTIRVGGSCYQISLYKNGTLNLGSCTS